MKLFLIFDMSGDFKLAVESCLFLEISALSKIMSMKGSLNFLALSPGKS